jgi:Flp pilus assembly protein TadG
MNFRKKRLANQRQRPGAAVVEFAVCLPVIVIIVFGAIEAANMLFLRQAMVQSSYEAAKVAIKANGSNAAAIQVADEVVAGRRIKNLKVEFIPIDVSTVAKGDLIRVTVSAPGNTNSMLPFGPFKDRTVAAQAAMIKE